MTISASSGTMTRFPSFFNFLLFLFPHYLKAAMRKGLFKKYIRRSYNDGNVKGTIDIANVSPRDDICITKHGLKIPMDATDYAGFVIKMVSIQSPHQRGADLAKM